MSFGNFLLGMTEGLNRGVEAGEKISLARDKKSARDAAKVATEDRLRKQVAAFGAERIDAPAGAAPGGPVLAAAQPVVRMPAAMPPPMGLPSPAMSPAARIGVQAPPNPYEVQYPSAIPRTMGVMGRFPADEQPYGYY